MILPCLALLCFAALDNEKSLPLFLFWRDFVFTGLLTLMNMHTKLWYTAICDCPRYQQPFIIIKTLLVKISNITSWTSFLSLPLKELCPHSPKVLLAICIMVISKGEDGGHYGSEWVQMSKFNRKCRKYTCSKQILCVYTFKELQRTLFQKLKV